MIQAALSIVLITGSSDGIGLATAEHLAKAGYRVYATCRDPSKAEKLQKVASEISTIQVLPLDVDSGESVKKAVAAIVEKEGRIDVVVNNAGFGIYGPSEMHTIEEVQRIFNTNFFGVIRVNHAVLPIMRKQLKGRIVNLGSIADAVPSKNIPIYSAAKAALAHLTASDASSWAEWNIKAILIQAGPVASSFESRTVYGSRFDGTENPYGHVVEKNRQGWKRRMDGGQTPKEIAQVIQDAIEDPKPNLWYQTSDEVREAVGKHYKDLTGNIRIPK